MSYAAMGFGVDVVGHTEDVSVVTRMAPTILSKLMERPTDLLLGRGRLLERPSQPLDMTKELTARPLLTYGPGTQEDRVPSVSTTTLQEEPTTVAGSCPSGQIGVPPYCYPPPGGMPAPPSVTVTTQPPQPAKKAEAETPKWLVPTLVGAGVLVAGVGIYMSKK